jgi:hypothetical protein
VHRAALAQMNAERSMGRERPFVTFAVYIFIQHRHRMPLLIENDSQYQFSKPWSIAARRRQLPRWRKGELKLRDHVVQRIVRVAGKLQLREFV